MVFDTLSSPHYCCRKESKLQITGKKHKVWKFRVMYRSFHSKFNVLSITPCFSKCNRSVIKSKTAMGWDTRWSTILVCPKWYFLRCKTFVVKRGIPQQTGMFGYINKVKWHLELYIRIYFQAGERGKVLAL
jgi:hypothetical protein